MYGSCPKPAAGIVPSLEGMSFSNLLALADAVSLRIKGNQLASHGVNLKQTPTPKQRRKKHQPKVITEGIAKRTRKPAIPKPVQSKGKPIGKRKYVRKPCGRYLNLELSEQPGDGNAVLGDETVHLGIGIDVVEKTRSLCTYLSNTDPPGTKLNAKSTENIKRKGPVTTLDGPSSLLANEPQALIIEPKESTKRDDKRLSQPVCCHNSMTKDIIEHSKGKEALNSNDSPGTTSLADESNRILLKSNEGNTREHPSSMSKPAGTIINQARQEKPCYGETQKELTDIVSSQCAAISSQISGGFSVDQNSKKRVPCSYSNSETKGPLSIAKRKFPPGMTFCKILEMAFPNEFKEVNSLRTKSLEDVN